MVLIVAKLFQAPRHQGLLHDSHRTLDQLHISIVERHLMLSVDVTVCMEVPVNIFGL